VKTREEDSRVLVVEAQIARQRAIIGKLRALRADTAEAKSLLSALLYSLKLLRQQKRRHHHRGGTSGTSASAAS
jgi:hypothetical protein